MLETAKNAEFDVAGGRFAEVVGQIRVVKSFVAEPRELTHFSGHYDATISLTRQQSRYWHRMDAILSLIHIYSSSAPLPLSRARDPRLPAQPAVEETRWNR